MVQTIQSHLMTHQVCCTYINQTHDFHRKVALMSKLLLNKCKCDSLDYSDRIEQCVIFTISFHQDVSYLMEIILLKINTVALFLFIQTLIDDLVLVQVTTTYKM